MTPPPVFVLTDRLDQLLAPPRTVISDLPELLQSLYDRKYTGPITLHFADGKPRVCELPAPQIRLDT